MAPLLHHPPSSFSQMVCKFAPPCCCKNLTVPDFSPSRWGTLFIQLEKSSHQNAHSSLYPHHLANSPKPPLKTTSDHLASAPSSSPALQLQLHKNAESDSSSFIRFPPEDKGSSKAFIARRSYKNRTIWEHCPAKNRNEFCVRCSSSFHYNAH